MSASVERHDVAVWISEIDPETPDGGTAIATWDKGESSQWAVPGPAVENDVVLGWVTGGTGFAYILGIQGPPSTGSGDKDAPQQALLGLVERVQPPIPMTRLKADPILRSWWPVRANMWGVGAAANESLTRDREWGAFLRLLEATAPKAAAALRERVPTVAVAESATPPTEGKGVDTVSLLDDDSTQPEPMKVTGALGDVMARASAINEERGRFDLSFSSLLLALYTGKDPLGQWLADYFEKQGVEIKHALGKVLEDITSDDAVAIVQKRADRGITERQSILSAPLRRTVSARQALAEAWRIAAAQGAPVVDAPHLMAALIALTDYHEEDFGALKLDRPRWGAAFVRHMARRALDPVEVDFWRRFYTRRFPGHELPPLEGPGSVSHRPDYDADAYTSRDLLSIEDEVSALGYIIASEQTHPPLAIGLFGEWGSGKTFFMKHLRRRIEQLCDGARGQKPSDRACLAHIAQIEFNAWHYQEGDLWASLVDHILRNLRFGEDEEETKVNERRDRIVSELGATEAREQAAAERATQAEARVATAEQRVQALQQQERNRRAELAEQLTPGKVLTAARAGIRLDAQLQQEGQALAAELGLPAVRQDAAALQDGLREAHRELAGVWAFLVPLFRARDRRVRLVLLGVALLVPVVCGLAASALLPQHDLLSKIAGAATGLVSLLGTTVAWVRRQTAWARALRERVEPVVQAVDRAIADGIESAVAEQKKAVAETLAQLDTLRREQVAAQAERETAAAQAAALRTTLATLGDDGLMRAFLDDRIGGGDYQQKLGIAALVRRDFERLSHKIERVTARERKGELKEGELVINRIVLYVDDLDRCQMDKVVPVLRAVHLLLAFPAFVVVVGVDSRWIARCLEKYAPDIFTDGQDDAHAQVTPLDYLEKIFQIPIWLEPVPPERRVFMVRELLRKGVTSASDTASRRAEPATAPTGTEPGAEPPRQPAAPGDQTGVASKDTPQLTAAGGLGRQPSAHPVAAAPKIDLNPRGLDITDGAYELLGRLGRLLSPTPRAIKRFANTYRLLNVALAESGMVDEPLRPTNAEVRMLLLTILVDMPDLSRLLQQVLAEDDAGYLATTPLIAVMMKSLQQHGEEPWIARAISQWGSVRKWLDEQDGYWSTMPAARVRPWLEPVGRYTFNLTRAAHAGLSVSGSPATQNGLPSSSPETQ